MSAAGTVVATSADGAGDMPSLEPAAGADASGDGAPTFSEVLSLSAPDLPSASGTSAPPPAPPDPDARHGQLDPAPTTAPEQRPPGRAGSTERRGHRLAAPATRGQHGRGTGSPDAPVTDRSGATGAVNTPSPTPTQAAISSIEPDETAAGALPLAPSPELAPPSTAPPPPADAAASAVLATGETGAGGSDTTLRLVSSRPEDGPAQASDAPSTDAPADDASSGAFPPDAPIGSDQNGSGSNPMPTVRTADGTTGSTDERVSPDRAAPPEPNAFHLGFEPAQPGQPVQAVQATGSSSVVPASVPSAAGAGTVATATGSADGAPEPAEFPDGGAGTAAPTLDLGDLAASISRPLAGGSGEYSVQVSLHPPELGEVRALLSLQGDVLHVTLTPEHPSGFDALSDAMPALREQLAGGGVEVNVTLGQPGDTQGEEGWRPADPGSSATSPSDDAIPAVTPPAFSMHSGSPGRIHLVL
jgi:flagellar hook-length control protein FliK